MSSNKERLLKLVIPVRGIQPLWSVSTDINGCTGGGVWGGGKSSEHQIIGVVEIYARRPFNWIINVSPSAERPSHPCSVIFIAKSVSY